MESILFESIFSEQVYTARHSATVILSQPWAEITTEEKALLSKILSAVRLSIDSVNIKQQSFFDLSVMKINSSKVIYFGNAVPGLTYYDHFQANGVSVVMSEKLSDLLINDEAKKKLWLALKKQFAV
ncbi:MAG TPA: hypothetical protein DGG95_01420 [Cytophagales bacterium]|jgi:DNA polymerase III psi subunit|nr:hypothetical protein [Cytophagales bacterium]